MYLLTIEYVHIDNCEMSIENKLFEKKENAIEELKKCKSGMFEMFNYATKAHNKAKINEETDDENDYKSIEITEEGIEYFDKHLKISVSKINCEDAEPMFSTYDFLKDEIGMIMESYIECEPQEHEQLISEIATNALDNDHLWEDFNSELVNIMRENEQYRKLEEECEESKVTF